MLSSKLCRMRRGMRLYRSTLVWRRRACEVLVAGISPVLWMYARAGKPVWLPSAMQADAMMCNSMLRAVRHVRSASLAFCFLYPAPECALTVLQLRQTLRA